MSGAGLVPGGYRGSFLLAEKDIGGLTSYLAGKAWLESGEAVRTIERAGEGNMNCVLRVRTNQRSFIVKQSRPWVEKYPAIAAPWDRSLIEEQFYRKTSAHPDIHSRMPELLAFDSEERLLLLEDLGDARDFTFLYSERDEISQPDLLVLTEFLVSLHTGFCDRSLSGCFTNCDMRKLNHEHIFSIPLNSGNGLSLDAITPGLATLARQLQQKDTFCREIAEAGSRYLDSPAEGCLLHGDYFPGSWLKTERGVFVIDPEFCFYGPPEWDMGVMLAHLYLSGQPGTIGDRAISIYAARAPLDRTLLAKFTGIEIIRRLIGVAQLPLSCGLREKEKLLDLARNLVLGNACLQC